MFSFNFTTQLRPRGHQGELAHTEAHLEQLRFHGGRDGGRADELEGGGRVVRVLRGERHQHLDAVAAAVHGHCAAPVRCVHLRAANQELLQKAAAKGLQRQAGLSEVTECSRLLVTESRERVSQDKQ